MSDRGLWVTGKKLNDVRLRAGVISNRLSIQRANNFMLDDDPSG